MLLLSALLILMHFPSPGGALTEVHHHHHHHHHHHFQGSIFCSRNYCYELILLPQGNTNTKECNCGEANEGPTHWIAGGEKVGVDEFPWIVSLHNLFMTLNGNPVFFCTGALLDPTHVLTAAHCLDAGIENIMVILASNNKEDLQPQHVAVNVTNIHPHPSYKEDTYMKGFNGSDVAVLTLASPVQYSHKIKPVCLTFSPGQ